MSFRGTKIDQLELKFEGGALTHASADSGISVLQAFLGSISDGSKQLSLVDFGVNPESRAPGDSSYSSWEMGGMVTLITGNNGWGGGDNLAEAGLTFHLPGSTVQVAGTQVVKAGALGP